MALSLFRRVFLAYNILKAVQNALHVTGKILWIERLSRFGIRNRKLTVKKKVGSILFMVARMESV